ncbi:MAG: zinc-binding dehydrogenase [Pirellulaceae bacterium]|jgi:NADPH:quinone reductase-like Zn-dependent oxidoreductase|nr:zinc-binding dehydrogenase [Pirellulaceae bacterium]
MSTSIPTHMRALVLDHYGDDAIGAIAGLKLADRPVPAPGRGQVLVRIEAAPCNPSDLLLLQGKYGTLKTLPTVPGWEGAGRVVAHGGGWLARWLQGRRVACAVQEDRDGTWGQYALANARECVPLRREVPVEQAASLIINPFTAVGLLDTARRGGHRAAVHTAAASQLGRMLVSLARECHFPIVHVVRRDEQADLLRSLGATHILNSSAADFAEALRATCRRLQATVTFEAVAGDLTGLLLENMPPGSTIYVYGALSQQACGRIDPIDLIFREQTVAGFFLGTWLRKQGSLGMLRLARRVQQLLLNGTIVTSIQRRLTLDQAVDGLRQYVEHMTDGKVLICP